MQQSYDKSVIVIGGATASGKTSCAIHVAQHWHTEIVSFDSRQFFREMTIGTAKPTAAELAQVKHHFIGHLSISQAYEAGTFEKDALERIGHLHRQYDTVVLVGGSFLYSKAVCEGLDTFPPVPPHIRAQVRHWYEQKGLAYLQVLVQEKDPTYYERAAIQNPRRLIRALEVCLAAGKPYSSFLQQPKVTRPFQCRHYYLHREREELYARINQRVDAMIANGLVEEARQLYVNRHLNALQTVGYQELFDYFEGKHSLKDAIDLVKRNTRRYAKRQMTWLRNHSHWIAVKNCDEIINQYSP